jgi:hypothetical protein
MEAVQPAGILRERNVAGGLHAPIVLRLCGVGYATGRCLSGTTPAAAFSFSRSGKMNKSILSLIVVVVLGALAIGQDYGPSTPVESEGRGGMTEDGEVFGGEMGMTEDGRVFQPQATATSASAQLKWEYKVLPKQGELTEHEMNLAGSEGWELICIVGTNNDFKLVFKRPK